MILNVTILCTSPQRRVGHPLMARAHNQDSPGLTYGIQFFCHT